MGLAGTEMRRAKLRFGLLTGAVALLVFLVLLLSTLSNALVSSLVGALQGLQTQGLVYADSARDNIVASRLAPGAVAQVAAVPGVDSAAGVGTFTTNAAIAAAAPTEVQVFGFAADGPGAPSGLSSGRLPTAPGETAIDGGGAAIGDTITLQPGGTALTVVGTIRGAQFNALPTAYVTLPTYDQAIAAANPGLPFVPINAVAFDVVDGQDVAAVAASIAGAVAGVTAYPLDTAVSLIPGIDSITQSFGILVGLTFVIGIVVAALGWIIPGDGNPIAGIWTVIWVVLTVIGAVMAGKGAEWTNPIRRVVPLLRETLSGAGLGLEAVDVVAYTRGPGLAGALLRMIAKGVTGTLTPAGALVAARRLARCRGEAGADAGLHLPDHAHLVRPPAARAAPGRAATSSSCASSPSTARANSITSSVER